MQFHIRHRTSYRYSRPVALDPHLLRIHPRKDAAQTIRSFFLDIQPQPAGMTEFFDLEGSQVAQVWFDSMTDRLDVSVETLVETHQDNPFQFIITDPGMMNIPVEYPTALRTRLAAYMEPTTPAGPIQRLMEPVIDDCGEDSMSALMELTRAFRDEFEPELRIFGPTRDPMETLANRSGACRDLALLFVECCRHLGFAARFVSGYWNGVHVDKNRHLHAWAEVYLPQAGWRGFDPNTGLAVADQHIPLAAGITPSGAAYISGAFWGSDVTSDMSASLHIHHSGQD